MTSPPLTRRSRGLGDDHGQTRGATCDRCSRLILCNTIGQYPPTVGLEIKRPFFFVLVFVSLNRVFFVGGIELREREKRASEKIGSALHLWHKPARKNPASSHGTTNR